MKTLLKKFKISEEAPSGVSSLDGKPLGYRRKDGYWILSYKGKQLLAHRVVWILYHGEIPEGFVIDHIDRNPSNNHISNLRCVTQAENLRNVDVRSHCKSGHKYIHKCSRTNHYTVRIGRKTYGTKHSLEEAISFRDSLLAEGVKA